MAPRWTIARSASGVLRALGAYAAVLFGTAVLPGSARATTARVDASLETQFYTVETISDGPVVRRRRYTETLGLSAYDLLSNGPDAPLLSLRLRLRLDGDLGQDPAERNPESEGRFVPGLYETPLDVMYAYLEGERWLGGNVGFRLGRQYVVDSLGWWSFDGLMLGLHTPAYLRVEGYAGFEQRGIRAGLGTSRFDADGVFRGGRSDLELGVWPSFLDERELAPAYGFAVHSAGVGFLRSNLSYRKVITRDQVLAAPFPDAAGNFTFVEGARVSSEKLGYALVLFDDPGSLHGNVEYDFHLTRWVAHGAGITANVSPKLALGADYDYSYAAYDGDSIFNWFTHGGTAALMARATFDPARAWSFAAAAGARRFSDIAGEATAGERTDFVGTANGRFRFVRGELSARSYNQVGRGSRWVGLDLELRRWFADRRYDFVASTGLHDFVDRLRPERGATSASYVIGGGYRPGFTFTTASRFGLEWEHHVNRLVGHRVRLLATLRLALSP